MVGKSLPLGTYTYRVVANYYQTTEGRITLNDKSNIHIEAVKLQDMLYPQGIMSKPFDSKVYINGQYVGKTAYVGDFCIGNYAVGDYDLELRHRNYYPLKQKVHFGSEFQKDSVPQFFELKKRYLKKYNGYIQGFVGTGMKHNTNMGFGVGAYIYNFNIEMDFAFYSRFSKSGIYTFNNYYITPQYAFSPKIGYGITVGNHWRITPQLGVSILWIKWENGRYIDTDYHACFSIGSRIEYAPASHFGLFLSPNGHFGDFDGYWDNRKLTKKVLPFDLKLGMFISF